MDDRTAYVLLAATIVLGLSLSSVFFAGPFYSFDDGTYITYAHQLLNGTFSIAESPYAYGFLFPASIASSFAVFGINVPASFIPQLAEYIALIVISFAAARRLYGSSTGAVSAFIIATAPFVVGYSTRVLPDMALGVVAGLSLLSFIYAQEGGKKGKLLYFLSGALAALTVYIKLIGLAFVLFFAIALLLHRIAGRKAAKGLRPGFLYSLAGAVALMLLYAGIFQLYGNGIFPALAAYGQNQHAISPTTLGKNSDSLLTALFGEFGYNNPYNEFAPITDPQVFPLGLSILFAICGTLIGLAKRDRSLLFVSVILWGVFLYLFFGTVTLNSYNLITVISRYFILVSVPIAVLSSYSLRSISSYMASRLRLRMSYSMMLLLAAATVSNVPAYNALYNYNASISGDIHAFSGLVAYPGLQGNATRLYVSGPYQSINFISFLSGYAPIRGATTAPLNILKKTDATAWATGACRRGGNVYLAIVYSNNSESLYASVLNNWIAPNCNLAEVETFRDNLSSESAYNGMGVEIRLYKATG